MFRKLFEILWNYSDVARVKASLAASETIVSAGRHSIYAHAN
jgi:hypothetical protein